MFLYSFMIGFVISTSVLAIRILYDNLSSPTNKSVSKDKFIINFDDEHNEILRSKLEHKASKKYK